jgi:hypothetical protein
MGDSGPDFNTTAIAWSKMRFLHGLADRSMPFTAGGAKYIPRTQLPAVQAGRVT